MPTNLATLYALQNRTNPAREKAKMFAEGVKTIEPDNYGYSSIAKIPLMYMYGQAAGEASNIDAQNNEAISGLMKSTVENEQLKAKNEGLKTQSTLDKNRVDMTAKVLETAMKMADTIDDDGASATSYLNQNKEAFGLGDDISISKVKKTGQHALIGLFNKNDNSESLFNFDTKNGKLLKVGKDNQWEEATPEDLTNFSKTQPDVHSPERLKQELQLKAAGKTPNENAITPQDRDYKQNLEVYLKYIAPAMKSDNPDEINRINNSDVGRRIKPEHLYTPNMDEGKKSGFWKGVKDFFGIGNDSATPTQPTVSPADAYAKGTPKKAVAPQKAAPTKPQGYSQADLEFTAKKHGISVDEVKRKLATKGK